MQVAGAAVKKGRHESHRKFKKESALSQSPFELSLGRNDSSCWVLEKGGGIFLHVVKGV